jgi:hypothetical protein
LDSIQTLPSLPIYLLQFLRLSQANNKDLKFFIRFQHVIEVSSFRSVEESIETARVELDGIVGAHLVAAVAADTVFSVDPGWCFIDHGDHMHRACVSACAAGYTLGFDDPRRHREGVPEDRI